jgi:bifunctional DNase/RNase
MAVLMELSRILIRELNDYQLIELREVDPEAERRGDADELSVFDEPEHQVPSNGLRSFPIVIGLPEAQAIERRLKNLPIKRPQTHDLLASVITALGGTLRSITINDLSEGTFFASLDVETAEGELLRIDSRPSDAIAIGIAGDVPIYVEEHVLQAASTDDA